MPARDYHEMQIGEWRIDVETNRLYREATEHQLSDKVCKVLLVLAEHPGRTVSREVLIQKVWNDNDYVGEQALNTAVWQLRKLFNDSSDAPEYIETIPKKGYRLLKPVKKLTPLPAEPEDSGPAKTPPQLTTTEDSAEKLIATKSTATGLQQKQGVKIVLAGLFSVCLLIALSSYLWTGGKDSVTARTDQENYWCGIRDSRISVLGILQDQTCMLDTQTGRFGFVTGERLAAISSRYYQPVGGNELSADIFFCEQTHKYRGKKANQPVNFVNLKQQCAIRQQGKILWVEENEQQASVICEDHLPAGIELEFRDQKKFCSLPEELLKNRENGIKQPEFWMGLEKNSLQSMGINPGDTCVLKAQDPTWIEPVELAWVWGTAQCQTIDGKAVACGSVNHGALARGEVVSDYYSLTQLTSLCEDAENPVELVPPRTWRSALQNKTHISASLLCQNQQPAAVQLVFKPVIGEIKTKRCSIDK